MRLYQIALRLPTPDGVGTQVRIDADVDDFDASELAIISPPIVTEDTQPSPPQQSAQSFTALHT